MKKILEWFTDFDRVIWLYIPLAIVIVFLMIKGK